jgi:DNA-binding CsgD family transcriptional regulator
VSEINVKGTALAVAGWVRVEQGDAAHVVVEMEALLARYLSDGEMQHVPSIILALSRALLATGRPDEATAHLQASWSVPELQRFVRARLWYRHDLALAELLAGRELSALDGFQQMLDDATTVANPQEQARAHFWLGQLDRRRGEHHRAEGHLHEALEIHAGHGYRQMAAAALEGVAGLEFDHGRPAVAIRLLGAAAAIRRDGGVNYRLGWQTDYDADLERARSFLDEDSFAEEWQRGTELRLPDAVELARRGRGERGRPTFGWDSLTATEQRVAALLVEGCTNPQIADTLLMGRETVKTHVSSILRKLGLANRTQVASAVASREEARRQA